MKKARTRLFLVVALGLLALCSVGLADEFADKSAPLLCAVGWHGEFTHIKAGIGEVPPTRSDLPPFLQALAWSPEGILYAGKENDLYTLDPWSGNVEHFLSVNSDIRGMAFSPSGDLYVTSEYTTAQRLRIIDLQTGNPIEVGVLGGAGKAQGLAFSPGGVLYGINPKVWPGTYELFTIDLDNAQMHLLGSYSSTANVNQSITFTADGRLYAIGRDAFAELNPTDGSLIGSHVTLSGDYRGLAILPPIVYYVDDDATGANNGSSWADAYNDLQDALASAWEGDEIRVAQGIYKPGPPGPPGPPDPPPPPGTPPPVDPRSATLQLKNGVTIKGGYAGAGAPDPNARDIQLYETILSGDLDGNDVQVNYTCDLLDEPTRSENSYHVVTASTTNKTAILDGFTITAGNANGQSYPTQCGGGMYNDESSPTIISCTFTDNSCQDRGGGIYIFYQESRPTLNNCNFTGNHSANIGGGICSYGTPILIHCIFSFNAASSGGGMWSDGGQLNYCTFNQNHAGGGGAMFISYDTDLNNCLFIRNSAVFVGAVKIEDAQPVLTNCTFTGNSAQNVGGLYNDEGTTTIINCIFWGNTDSSGTDESAQIDTYDPPIIDYCCIQGWTGVLGGTGNINADPLFVDAASDKYHLLPTSPCIDAGDPNYIAEPNETDLDGRPRIIGDRIDMGAYESPVFAQARIVPRTINLQSKGKWISCYIWLPEDYDVADIDPNSVFLEEQIKAEQLLLNEQQQVATAKFIREDVQAILDVGEIEMTITGQLADGTIFEATDVIRVIDKASRKPAK